MNAALILLPALLSLVLVAALWRARDHTEWFMSLLIAGGFVAFVTGQYLGFMAGATVALCYLGAGGLIILQVSRKRWLD